MGRDMVYETVPVASRRIGDTVMAGANNATIILGRDRLGGVETGRGGSPGAGAIHLVVGRKSEDPVPSNDAATVYLSALTDPDDQADTKSLGPSQSGVSAVVIRGDCVRMTARTDMKIAVGGATITLSSDGTIVIDGTISLGRGAPDAMLKGTTFRLADSAANNALAAALLATAAALGALGAIPLLVPFGSPAIVAPAVAGLGTAAALFQNLEAAAANYLSQRSKVL